MTLVLGMDIGGSGSRARLAAEDGTTVAEAEAASASLTAAGPERAERAVGDLLIALGLQRAAGAPGRAGEPLAAVCVGTAGSGSAAAVDLFVRRLAPLTSTNRIIVVNDSRLVLPAAGMAEGIAVISGTGSTAVAVAGGQEERAGGWGYLLGDEGSGYWIAREGVRHVLRRHDAHEDLGPLGEVLVKPGATGASAALLLLHRFHDLPSPDGWARLAPLVLDCGDPASGVIADGAALALARLAGIVVRLLPPETWPDGPPFILAGGLMTHHGGLAERTRMAIRAAVPGAAVSVATEPPVAGAVRMALQAAG